MHVRREKHYLWIRKLCAARIEFECAQPSAACKSVACFTTSSGLIFLPLNYAGYASVVVVVVEKCNKLLHRPSLVSSLTCARPPCGRFSDYAMANERCGVRKTESDEPRACSRAILIENPSQNDITGMCADERVLFNEVFYYLWQVVTNYILYTLQCNVL